MEHIQEQEEQIIERLSPLEIKIVPFLNKPFEEIKKKSGLDEVSLMRALRLLETKNLIVVQADKKSTIALGINGIYYKKNQLPERALIMALEKTDHLPIEEARIQSKLSDNEFKVSLGVLKDKAFISLANGKLNLLAKKEEIVKKSLEEQLMDVLPIELEKLTPEQKFAFENLKKRKGIVEVKSQTNISLSLTSQGELIAGKEIKSDLIEEVTPEVIKDWTKGKKFRKYDIIAQVPKINGGKKHFVSQSIEYAKKVWTDMGFKEMTGNKVVSSFWNFDALFTAQDHPVRELHDTFFIKDMQAKLPSKELVEKVKRAHETGIGGSKGWQYHWDEKNAKRVLLRTHTTALSSQTLAKLKKEDLPAKYFAIGKCFRNETVDWKHGFEFNQTEGIVIDPDANLQNLIGYLTEFAKKMGFEKVKFQPSFFPYTEPSVEGLVWNEEKKEWLEVFAAGIFRPEVTIPLFGTAIPVLAWGPGFDRLMMMAYHISDMRELYANDLKILREKEVWKK
jgi:phenylalanyl-tRNA synthetase alpha chain